MPKVQIWGFECSRCHHKWVPREGVEHPATCPNCKSPYWDKPRRADLIAQGYVKCVKWQAHELRDKTVEFDLIREGKSVKGFGTFTVTEGVENLFQIIIEVPSARGEGKKIMLSQAEADRIESHISSRRFRFRCVC